MRCLVWQWGRRGSPPRLAADFADALRGAGATVALSLSRQAEIMRGPEAPACDLPVSTYDGLRGVPGAALRAPLLAHRIARWL
ncbi:MAG: hypothetical protein SNJ73_09910, partial [Acetobacteraceae bacterium]